MCPQQQNYCEKRYCAQNRPLLHVQIDLVQKEIEEEAPWV